MQHPFVCPVCLEQGEILEETFEEFTSIIEQKFGCPKCDTEWMVPFVMVEKIITKDGRDSA